MVAVLVTVEDLTPFVADIDQLKAQAMIDDAVALAARVAPCIVEDGFEHADAARAILRGVVLRWNDTGSGALQSSTIGPFGMTMDTRQQRRGMFWPSEIEQLQGLCKANGGGGAFSIDPTPSARVSHSDICSMRFGGLYCSCGAVLTLSGPLYEGGS